MKIVGVHKENGTISQYKLDNGKVVNKEKCINMVKKGKIEDCNIGMTKNMEEFIRTNRDSEDENGKQITNLNDLPNF